MNILLLSQGQHGLVSLATYPISPLYVMYLSSEPTCTYLYGMKAPDGGSYVLPCLAMAVSGILFCHISDLTI